MGGMHLMPHKWPQDSGPGSLQGHLSLTLRNWSQCSGHGAVQGCLSLTLRKWSQCSGHGAAQRHLTRTLRQRSSRLRGVGPLQGSGDGANGLGGAWPLQSSPALSLGKQVRHVARQISTRSSLTLTLTPAQWMRGRGHHSRKTLMPWPPPKTKPLHRLHQALYLRHGFHSRLCQPHPVGLLQLLQGLKLQDREPVHPNESPPGPLGGPNEGVH